jgi:fibronectin type 3 domain-containing protein
MMAAFFPLRLSPFFNRQPRSLRRRRRGVSSASLEALESRLMLSAISEPFERHFDFGTPSSPVAQGNAHVSPSTRYSAALGFGWSQGTINARDRGVSFGDDRARDFNFTPVGTFSVDAPPGIYEVTMTMGDGIALRDEMALFLEGTQVDTVTAQAGQIETRTFSVAVLDGQFTLLLQDLGGDPIATINSLDLVRVGGAPSGPRVVNTTPDVEAFDQVDRIVVRFNEAVDASTLTVDDVTLTGPLGPIIPTAIQAVSSDTFEIHFAPQTEHGDYTLSLRPEIADLDGCLMNQDGDESNGEAGEDGFSFTFTLCPTPAYDQTFDFGTNSSPLAEGAARVDESSTYDPAGGGFGWTEGTIGSRDRGTSAGDDLARDLNFLASGTFVVDVLAEDAVYDVTVTMGDHLAARDEMAVILEGEQVAVVATAVGASHSQTFRVTVTDGQLTLQIQDLGGSDPTAVINGLRIRHVETLAPPDDGEDDDGGSDDDGDGGDGNGDGDGDGDGDNGDGDGGGTGDGDDDCWKKKKHHKLRKLIGFLVALRKKKFHKLPSVASKVAFHPPGHGGECPGKGKLIVAAIVKSTLRSRGHR